MTVFHSKADFIRLGAYPITPSTSFASQDCYVCKVPLALHQPHPSSCPSSHPALRIIHCGHILGIECISAWINTSNTCPVCSRMLFECDAQAITQEDVYAIVNSLGRMYSERRIMRALARCMQKQEVEERRLRRENEENRRRDAQVEAARRNEARMTEGEWMDSDAEMGGDDDDEENFDADAVFGVDEEDEEL